MLEDNRSVVWQGGSVRVSGFSEVGGSPGLRISGLRIHVRVFSKEWKSIRSDTTSLILDPVVNIISAENK